MRAAAINTNASDDVPAQRDVLQPQAAPEQHGVRSVFGIHASKPMAAQAIEPAESRSRESGAGVGSGRKRDQQDHAEGDERYACELLGRLTHPLADTVAKAKPNLCDEERLSCDRDHQHGDR